MNKRLSMICAAVLTVCVILCGCAGKKNENTSGADSNIVMSVNGEDVTVGEFKFYLETIKYEIAVEMGKTDADAVDWETDKIEGEKVIDIAKQRAFDNIVETKVVASEARAKGVSVSDEEMAAVSVSVMSYFGVQDIAGVAKICEASDEVIVGVIEDITMSQKYAEVLYENADVSDEVSEEELRALYDSVYNEIVAMGGDVQELRSFDDEQLRQQLTEQIIEQRREAFADERIAVLVESATVEKNDEVYSKIK